MNDTRNNYKVYKYTNQINGMSYIGWTGRSLKERSGANGFQYKRLKYFGPAIKQYGWANFKPEIIKDNLAREEAKYWEEYSIMEQNTCWPNGYNDSVGYKLSIESKEIRTGKHHTEEAKRKVSEAHKGKPCSEETKRKIRESLKGRLRGENHPMYGKQGPMLGRHLSEEARKKVSISKKGIYVGDKAPWYGKKHSPEAKAKMSEARRRYWENKKSKVALADPRI